MLANYHAHAFLWQNGTMTDLGTLGGDNSRAFGINSQGQVVGTAQIAQGDVYHAFLYSGGTMIDLNAQLPANSGWTVISDANSINDNGQIAGTGITASGFTHGYLINLNS
jgi:probable HAF family extracellular repeat protein